MPTLVKIAEDIIKSSQGAIFAEQSKFQIPYLYDLIHQYREVVLRLNYTKSGKISPISLQQYAPEFSEALQESKLYVKFECPSPIVLDEQTDGFLYIGTLDKSCNFRKNQNRAELAMYQSHRVTKVGIDGKIKTIYSDGFLEVWGNPLQKEIRIDGVFSNPTLLPDYNFDLSDYPISGGDLAQLKDLISKAQTDKMAQTPANFKQTMVDLPTAISK